MPHCSQHMTTLIVSSTSQESSSPNLPQSLKLKEFTSLTQPLEPYSEIARSLSSITMTALNCASWMYNQDRQDPCVIAQEVGQLCNSTYAVSSVNFQESQYTPSNVTANGCTCSWSIYNLLSACANCTGGSQLISWNAWTTSCGVYVSNNSYLPSGLGLSQGIPYWAVTNPSAWYNGVFNVTQASGIAAADKPDITGGPVPTSSTPSSSSHSSKTSVGAIAGGVIGGVVVVVVAGMFIFCLLRRRRRLHQTVKEPGAFNGTHSITNPAALMRGPNGFTVQPRRSPMVSPVPGGYSSNGHSTISDMAAFMISPFYGQNQARPNAPTGKAAEARAERAASQPTQRARLNPPPYSPSTSPSSSDTAPTWKQRLSTKRYAKPMTSMVEATSGSASKLVVSNQESVDPPAGPSRSHSASEGAGPGSVEGHGGQGMDDGRAVASHGHPADD